MARASGRQLLVQRNIGSPPTPTTIAAIRTKNPTIAREPVDVTADDDNGWRVLLDVPGQQQIDLSFSGITENDELIAAIFAGSASFEDIIIVLPSGATVQGNFFFNNLSLTGEYNNAVTFEGEMQSSGEPTFTPAP